MKVKVEVVRVTVGYGHTTPGAKDFHMHRFYFEPTLDVEVVLAEGEKIDFDALYSSVHKKVYNAVHKKIKALREANQL